MIDWKTLFITVFCASALLPSVARTQKKPPYESVDVFIGTREMGHTFPGAAIPFGMVQLSPDTGNPPFLKDNMYNPAVYRYCAGYQYDDPTIIGFSHTHFNGTGHSDLGDFLIMPTRRDRPLEPGVVGNPDSGFRSRFSHATERAAPGYYRVRLEDTDIDVELTASSRVGFHKYTFSDNGDSRIILDMIHSIYDYDGKVIWSSIRIENDRLVTGFRQTRGWGQTRYLYFALVFSKPFKRYGYMNNESAPYRGFWDKAMKQKDNFPEMTGRKVRAYFDFDTVAGESICLKLALSAVSTDGARQNLEAEIPHWDFEQTRREARLAWERELGKVEIDAEQSRRTIFYTALYHSLLSPIEYMDHNGRYRGIDQNIHRAEGFTHYTLFSLWDTYRALHPWLTILQPRRAGDMIRSMLAHYEQSVHRILPIWSFHANETWCMIGYHAVPVIVDAFIKGIDGFDAEKAFQAVVDSATHAPYSGLGNYMKIGYVPADGEFGENSASKTVEYAYDDWTISRLARALGRTREAEEFTRRAVNYRNLFDPGTGFIRARTTSGKWTEPFDPLKTSGQGYIEGNAWNYSLHIPQDIRGYIRLLGGDKVFIDRLDSLFRQKLPAESVAGSEDTAGAGMVGGYIHGNEPGHHIPYLYNYAGIPWKTQAIVRRVLAEMYSATPDGIAGNDDTGQMSAWYLFSAMGFYPVCPGSDQYVIGSPCLDRAVIHLENGRKFTMLARNLSAGNIYIQSAEMNGVPLARTYITHEEIIRGGNLVFHMSAKPNRNWASSRGASPYSLSD